MRINDPTIPPRRRLNNITMIDQPLPTAALRSGFANSAAELTAATAVTSPRTSVTTFRVRSGSFPPANTPTVEPKRMATILITVPKPVNSSFS